MTITIEEWRSRAQSFEFEGANIAYWKTGTGRPLLLIHGFPTASWDWAPIWQTLARKHTVIAVDMVGFGLSAKPRSKYSIDLQADMILELLDHLGISEFDVLAHDYGASVGQELIARQREGSGAEKLRRIVFLNGGVFPQEQRARFIMRMADSPLGFMVSKAINRKMFGKSISALFGTSTQPTEQELDDLWSMVTEFGGNKILHRLAHFLGERIENEARWVDAMTAIPDRVGYINGASDPISGEHSYREWINMMPEANEHLLSSIGHYPHLEAPAEVASTTLNWLS